MRKIKLKNCQYFIVDDDMFDSVSKFKWYLDRYGYVRRYRRVSEVSLKTSHIYIHRQLMNFPENLLVDHINHNKLDNRRQNLRICTKRQNSLNGKKRRGNYTSKYRGVSWSSSNKMWLARVGIYSKFYSSFHKTEIGAAKKYDELARKYYKEFACPNFPTEEERKIRG